MDSRRANGRLGTFLREKYRLDRVLGEGGMAVVYAATHRNRRQFAIKMLHPELSMIEEVCRRFQREGYAANTVAHPGTVAVLDDDIAEDGSAFLVMELVEGIGVDVLPTRTGGRTTILEALGIAYQLLDVLAAAHEKGIIHRDIKPANLFLDRSGQVKVLDFGIARIREATASHLATGTGTTLGTPAFMAPEQALGNTAEVDARTDLWAVGATVFTLVSGVLVHEGETAPQMLVHAATRPARSLASVAGDAPPAVVDLVARALAFEKSARFGSALEMQAEVARVHEQLFGQGPSRDLLISSAGGVMPAVPRPSTPPSTAPVSVSNGVSASASAARSASQARAAVSAPDTAGTSAPRRTALISALAMGAAVLMGVVLWTLVRENAAGSAGPAQGSEPPVVTTAHAAPPPPPAPPPPAPPPEDHVTVEPVQTASAAPAVAVIPAASASASGQVPPHPQPAPRTRPARSADVRASTSPAPSVAPHNPLDMHLQ